MPTPKVAVKSCYLSNCSQKLHGKERNCNNGGCIIATPIDPPMHKKKFLNPACVPGKGLEKYWFCQFTLDESISSYLYGLEQYMGLDFLSLNLTSNGKKNIVAEAESGCS